MERSNGRATPGGSRHVRDAALMVQREQIPILLASSGPRHIPARRQSPGGVSHGPECGSTVGAPPVPLGLPLPSRIPESKVEVHATERSGSRVGGAVPPAFTLVRTYISLMRRVAARQGLEPNSRNSGSSSKATATSCRRVALAAPRHHQASSAVRLARSGPAETPRRCDPGGWIRWHCHPATL